MEVTKGFGTKTISARSRRDETAAAWSGAEAQSVKKPWSVRMSSMTRRGAASR